MRKSNFALRLQPSLLDEARRLAAEEGVALNQLINVSVAEKVSALRTESYIAERAAGTKSSQGTRNPEASGCRPSANEGDELAETRRRRPR
jgi:hypothetical protein